MRKILPLALLSASIACIASPVKSMLGANGTETSAVSPLPYDAEVAYLRGDGSSAILTDLNWRLCDFYTEVDFTMPDVRDTVSKVIIGSDGSVFNYVEVLRQWRTDYFSFSAYTTPPLALASGVSYTGAIWFEDSLCRFNLNGADATYSATAFGRPKPLCIFSNPRADYTDLCFKGDIHAVRVYTDTTKSVLVAHYIPVRVGEEGYLFDTVSFRLFGNVGTGNFLVGPDLN